MLALLVVMFLHGTTGPEESHILGFVLLPTMGSMGGRGGKIYYDTLKLGKKVLRTCHCRPPTLIIQTRGHLASDE